MADRVEVDVLIVGSGPAGTSTALHLVKANPVWARRILVVDKAIHPREKLCGGGITHMGQNMLANLGLKIETPSMPLRRADVVYEDLVFSFKANPVFVVIRRDEFDHWLVQQAESRGIVVRQGEAVKNVQVFDEYVEVQTEKSIVQAKVLVAADGSRSFIRSKLNWDDQSRVARLLEILTPEDEQVETGFIESKAVFDFTPVKNELQGYYWDFPSVIKGKAFMNRGLFDSRAQPDRPKADLKKELKQSLERRDRKLDDYKLKGHPIRWYSKDGRFSIPRVLLAGDAAGTDPLVGEGISFAVSYGDVAANAIVAAFNNGDFTFADYGERIIQHRVLRQLPIRTQLARLAYKLSQFRWLCRLAWRVSAIGIKFTRWNDPEHVPVRKPEQAQLSEVARGHP